MLEISPLIEDLFGLYFFEHLFQVTLIFIFLH